MIVSVLEVAMLLLLLAAVLLVAGRLVGRRLVEFKRLGGGGGVGNEVAED